MKPKTLILMVVAVVCGLGASYMTSRLLAERSDAPAEAPVIAKVKLLVAKKQLDMHTPLRDKPDTFFVEKEYVKDDAPKDALTLAEVAKLKGKFLKRSLRKGDHITLEDVMDNKFGLGNLEPGHRAIGIKVDAQQIVGGWASLPGSRVDVHWTQRTQDNDTITKVLFESVLVLAVDGNKDITGDHTGAMLGGVLIVSLSADDALRATAAMQSGAITFVLRNIEDKGSTENAQVNSKTLMKTAGTGPKKGHEPIVEPELPKDTVKPPVIPNKDRPPVAIEEPSTDLPPLPKGWRKFTQVVQNAQEKKSVTYWLDGNNNVVPSPEGIYQIPLDLQSQPAPKGKKD